MFIVNQMRKSVINTNNVVDVYQVHEKIFVGTTVNQEQVIAKYESEERASEVFEDMLRVMFSRKILISDTPLVFDELPEEPDEQILNACGTYYMPEV